MAGCAAGRAAGDRVRAEGLASLAKVQWPESVRLMTLNNHLPQWAQARAQAKARARAQDPVSPGQSLGCGDCRTVDRRVVQIQIR